MMSYIIPLLSSFLDADFLSFWFYPVFCLAFIATVPRIIRTLIER